MGDKYPEEYCMLPSDGHFFTSDAEKNPCVTVVKRIPAIADWAEC